MTNTHWSTGAVAATLLCCTAILVVAGEKATREVSAKDIKLTVPKAWKQEEPSNKLRVAQFKIDAADGDKEPADLVVNQFGGGGGGVEENLKRWVNQFAAKDRKLKITTGKCRLGEYLIFDATGTYNKPDGPPMAGKTIPVPGQRMLQVMLMTDDKGTYFLKLTGPEKTVSNAADDLRTSFGAKAQDEKEYKPAGE